ncbi:MAG: flavodoxin family protein [Clostridia bacterium]|nr:flavodoxin family protein [Clostridia bacterium]
MKVLLVNGSPHKEGCTYTALSCVAKALNEDGIETEIINVSKTNSGCMGCGYCFKMGKCVNDTDIVNETIARLNEFDGFVFGSPVHYASASGAITCFMDRLFYSGSKDLRYKVGAVVASARRGGTTATLDQLTKHLTISNMPVVSSSYWNMVHGSTPEDVLKDEEGMQTMRTLGHNMAWLLKCIELGKENGVSHPAPEAKIKTNFIR